MTRTGLLQLRTGHLLMTHISSVKSVSKGPPFRLYVSCVALFQDMWTSFSVVEN